MNALKRSDFWFGIVLAVFFALAAFVFFGSAVMDSNFWLYLVAIIGFSALGSFVRGPLGNLDRTPRYILWFSIGVTMAVTVSLLKERPIEFLPTILCGLALVGIGFLPDSQSLASESKE